MTNLIWSNEHRLWWKPNGCGYTSDAWSAGRYAAAEADRLCPTSIRTSHTEALRKDVPVRLNLRTRWMLRHARWARTAADALTPRAVPAVVTLDALTDAANGGTR